MVLKAGIKLALDVYEPYGPQVLQYARLTEQLGGRFDAAGRALAAADKLLYGYYSNGAGGQGRMADFLHLFTGGLVWAPVSNFAGVIVPIVGPIMTNNGYVAGDYSASSGILPASGKFFDTNINANSLPQNTSGMGIWSAGMTTINTRFMGVRNVTSTQCFDIGVHSTTGNFFWRVMNSSAGGSTTSTGGFNYAQRISSATIRRYVGATGSNDSRASTAFTTSLNIYLGALNANGAASAQPTDRYSQAYISPAILGDPEINILFNAATALETARASL